MSGWDNVTADAIRDELAGFAGDAGTAADGWLTLAELSARFGVNRHAMAAWLELRQGEGALERSERPGQGVDGRRITRTVYRLVEQRES